MNDSKYLATLSLFQEAAGERTGVIFLDDQEGAENKGPFYYSWRNYDQSHAQVMIYEGYSASQQPYLVHLCGFTNRPAVGSDEEFVLQAVFATWHGRARHIEGYAEGDPVPVPLPAHLMKRELMCNEFERLIRVPQDEPQAVAA